jgi:lysophospholipase L1-like esterase
MKKYLLVLLAIAAFAFGIIALVSHQKKPVTAAIVHKKYVALGDSVAAGVGLMPDRDSSACGRTNQSYPYLISQKLQYDLNDFSCTGATISAGIVGGQVVNKLIETPQLDKLFESPKPDVITITIGANDADWTEFIGECYTARCGTPEDVAKFDSRLESVTSSLRDTLNKISEHYADNKPLVLVTGYYHVFPSPGPNCTDLNGIDPGEMSFIRHQQEAISLAVKAAVTQSPSTRFVPLDFSGHELCNNTPWVQGIGDKQPYHPTAAGQAEIARLLELEITSNQ